MDGSITNSGLLQAGGTASLYTGKGTVTVTGAVDAQDNVTVKTTNGDVLVQNNITSHAGDISVTSRIGDIRSSGVLTAANTVSLNALTNGEIYVNNQVNGKDIAIQTDFGDIETIAEGTLTATATNGTGGTITVDATKGDITLRGVARADQKVELKSSDGSVTVTNAVTSNAGNISITSTKGDITSSGVLTANQKVSLNALTSGKIEIYNQITGKDIEIQTANGNIETNATGTLMATATGGTITVGATKGDITLRGTTTADQKVELKSSEGSVTVTNAVTSNAGDISVTSTKGDITNSGVLTANKVNLKALTSGNINVNNQVSGMDIEIHAANGNIETANLGAYINAGSHLVLTAEKGNIGRKNNSTSKLIPLLILNNPNLDIDVTAQNAWLKGVAPSTENMGTMMLQKVNITNEFRAESEGELTVKKVTGIDGEIMEAFTATDMYLNAAGNLIVNGNVKADGTANLMSQTGIITTNGNVIGGQVYISTEETEREEGSQSGNVIINNRLTATAKNGIISISTNVGDINTATAGVLNATSEGGTITIGASQGNIILGGVATADQKVKVDAVEGSVTLDGTVESQDGEVEIAALGAVTANATIQAGANVKLLSKKADVVVRNTVTSLAGSVNATAQTGLAVIGSVHAENNIILDSDAGGITVSAQVTSDTGNISMTAGGRLIEIGDTVHAIQGNVTAHVDTVRTSTDTASPIVNAIGVGGDIIAGRTVSLTAEEGSIGIGVGATTAQGKVDAGGNIIISSGKGEIDVYNSVTSTGGDISISNVEEAIYVQGAVIASAGDVKTTSVTGDILVSKDISVGENKNVLLETTKGNIYVGTFTDEEHGTVSTSGSIGATEGNTAGNVTIKTGEGVIDILKSIASTNIKVENGKGDIFIGINQPSEETVTATNNIYLSTELGQIKVYGKTSTDHGDITMKAAANNFNEENPGSNFIIGQYGQVDSGRDITLEGQNGDIHITDKIAAERNVNATIKDKGSLYFDYGLNADGAIKANVEEGNIEIGANLKVGTGGIDMQADSGNINIGHSVTATDSSIAMQTGTGNIGVGATVTS